MKHFLLLFFILFIFKTKAQENTAFKEEIFTIVEEMPIYAGCNKSSQQLNNKCTIKGIINFLLDSVLPLASEKIVNDLGKIYLSFIVDVDGINELSFSVPAAAYYICLSHRNHLGIMSAQPIDLGKVAHFIDFTTPNTEVFGEHARKELDNKRLLWGGDADSNGYLVLQGAGISLPDSNKIFFDVLSDEKNKNINCIIFGVGSNFPNTIM